MNPTAAQSETERSQFTVGSRTETTAAEEVLIAYAGRYRTALYDASSYPTDASKQAIYLDAGMAVSDLFCNEFLSVLAKKQVQLEATRDYANIAGGVAAGVLGLLSAPTAAVAAVGIGSAALDDTLSTTQTNFLVAPDVPLVQRLVEEAREKLRNRLQIELPPNSFPDAQRKLLSYDTLCSFNGIKLLVNDAVKAGKIKFKDDEEASRSNLLAAQSLRARIASLMGLPHVTESQTQALYAYFVTGAGLDPKVKPEIDKLFPTISLPAVPNSGEVVRLLEEIARRSDLAAKSADWVASLQKVANTKVAADAATTGLSPATVTGDPGVKSTANEVKTAIDSVSNNLSQSVTTENVESAKTISNAAVQVGEAASAAVTITDSSDNQLAEDQLKAEAERAVAAAASAASASSDMSLRQQFSQLEQEFNTAKPTLTRAQALDAVTRASKLVAESAKSPVDVAPTVAPAAAGSTIITVE